MEKVLLLTGILLLTLNTGISQSCMPDSMYLDSTAGVFPAPITMDNPDGGIEKVACVGIYYEYVLTVIIPDSAVFNIGGNAVEVDLISAQIADEGAIEGLPPGISYLCMPENCLFPSESSGCILLYGTVEEGTEAKKYPLSITMQVTVRGLGTLNIDFPGAQFPGEYYLEVASGDSSACMASSVISALDKRKIYPNPVSREGSLHIEDAHNIDQLLIYNISGQLVENIQSVGTVLPLDDYQEGLYILCMIENGKKQFFKLRILD